MTDPEYVGRRKIIVDSFEIAYCPEICNSLYAPYVLARQIWSF